MLEQKGTNKKSHRAGAWRRIDHALVDHALVDHALVARANFAIWPRKKTGKFRSPPRILQTFQSGVCIYVYGDIQLTFQYTIISIT